jgi:hypothetical protein
LLPFQQLITRHQNHIYLFIHQLYLNDTKGLFENLLCWGESILSFLRIGIGPIDLQEMITRSVQSIQDKYLFMEDLDRLKHYRQCVKQRRLRKLRARIQATHDQEMNDLLKQVGLDEEAHNIIDEDEVTPSSITEPPIPKPHLFYIPQLLPIFLSQCIPLLGASLSEQ